MLKTSGKKPTEMVFTNLVRGAVREEMKSVKEELYNELDIKFRQFREEIISAIKVMVNDFRSEMTAIKIELLGEMKSFREEMTIIGGDHQRVLDLEDKVEDLEKIHPQGQHPTI